MKKLYFTIAALFMAISASFAYSGGNGSEMFPYLISSKADMEELAANVNSGQKYAGIHFQLTTDLTGTENQLTTTIGNSTSNYFSGIFDGNDHEVETKSMAIFGHIQNATIKNLGVSGNVTSVSYSTTSVYDNYYYVGGICAKAVSSTVSNCYNNLLAELA